MSVEPEDLEAIRQILDELTSKWTLLVLNVLCRGPARFNMLKRACKGVTQKALTQCLRRLEASGLIIRSVVSTSPVAVVYEVSPLGASLEPFTKGLLQWSAEHRHEVLAAQSDFAARNGHR
jgi:DNA-binding HxlR family transcriptional regulator